MDRISNQVASHFKIAVCVACRVRESFGVYKPIWSRKITCFERSYSTLEEKLHLRKVHRWKIGCCLVVSCRVHNGSLLLTKDAAREDLGPLLPISKGENKTTIIIDHFEDLMDLFGVETMALAKNWTRETYDTCSYRVLVCVAPESRALEVLNWNGGVKFRYVHTYNILLGFPNKKCL